MEKINHIIAGIKPLDERAMDEARMRQDNLTKPQGSLGELEALSIQVAGIKGNPRPRISHKVIFVLAGDHGVAKEGVPREHTRPDPGDHRLRGDCDAPAGAR